MVVSRIRNAIDDRERADRRWRFVRAHRDTICADDAVILDQSELAVRNADDDTSRRGRTPHTERRLRGAGIGSDESDENDHSDHCQSAPALSHRALQVSKMRRAMPEP